MNEKIKNLLQNAHRRKITYAVIMAMSIVAVLSVFFALERPGITVTKDSGEIKITEKLPDESETEIIDKDVQFNEQQQSNDITPDISYIPDLSLAPKQMFAGSDYDTVVELDEENNCKYTFGYDYSLIIEPINAGTDCIARPLAERDTYLKDLVESIKFKNGITSIVSSDSKHFADDVKNTLKSLDFSECTTLNNIGSYAFSDCRQISSVVDLSACENLEVITNHCFYNTFRMPGVKLPKSIIKISEYAFAATGFSIYSSYFNSYDYYSINFNELENLEIIENYAFQYVNTKFKNLDLRGCKKLKSIGKNAFEASGSNSQIEYINLSGLTNLETLEYQSLSYMGKNCTTIDISGCTNLKTIDGDTFTSNTKNFTDINFSGCSSITSLPKFRGFSKLVSIDLSGCTGITAIPNETFKSCTSLKIIDLSNITSIGTSAFSECSALADVDLSNVTSIGSNAFLNCSALSEINLSDNIKSIGQNAFKDCTNVEKITYNLSSNCSTSSGYLSAVGSYSDLTFVVKGTVDKIDKYVNGKYIDHLIFEPNDSITFETGAFSDYGKPLKSMADGTTKYKADDNGVLYSADGSVLYFVPEKIQSLTVPETVKTIKSNAFAKAKKITVLKFAGNTKNITIEGNAFSGAKNLKEVAGLKSTQGYDGVKDLFAEGSAVESAFEETPFERIYAGVEQHDPNPLDPEKTNNPLTVPIGTKQLKILADPNSPYSYSDDNIKQRYPSIANAEKKTIYYLTGQSAALNLMADNNADDQTGENNNEYFRLYLKYSNNNFNNNLVKTGITEIKNGDDLAYSYIYHEDKERKLIYLDVRVDTGATVGFEIGGLNYSYITTDGGELKVWAEPILSIESAADEYSKDKAGAFKKYFEKAEVHIKPQSGEYDKFVWYTAPAEFGVSKKTKDTKGLNLKTEESFADDAVFEITTSKKDVKNARYGSDYVRYLEYEDVFDLPLKDENGKVVIDWSNAVKNGTLIVKDKDIYAGNVLIAQLSGSNINNVKAVYKDGKLKISWRVINTNTEKDSNTNLTVPAEIKDVTTTVTFKFEALKIIKENYSFEKTGEPYKITNNVTQKVHYTFADESESYDKDSGEEATNDKPYPKSLFEQTSSAEIQTNNINPRLEITKETSIPEDGSDYHNRNIKGGENADFTLTVKNPEIIAIHPDKVTDKLPYIYAIDPDKMEKMFAEKYGGLLKITVEKAGILSNGISREELTTIFNRKNNIDWIYNKDAEFTETSFDIEKSGSKFKVTLDGQELMYDSLTDFYEEKGIINKRGTVYNCVWDYAKLPEHKISQFEMNEDGTIKTDANGKAIETPDILHIYSRAKTTFEIIEDDTYKMYKQGSGDSNSKISGTNTATLQYTYNDEQKEDSDSVSTYWFREYSVNKTASINGSTLTTDSEVFSGEIVKYDLELRHMGSSVNKNVPIEDDMKGTQVLLVPKSYNSSLAGKGLEEYPQNNPQYYVLNKTGEYKNVKIGGGNSVNADSINVVEKENGEYETTITWCQDAFNGSYVRKLKYQALVLDAFTYRFSNCVTLNHREGDRLYDGIAGSNAWGYVNVSSCRFDKNIVVKKGNSAKEDVLVKDKVIKQNDTVIYRLDITNYSSNQRTFDVYDTLPETYGAFGWKKGENLTSITAVSSLNRTTPATAKINKGEWTISEPDDSTVEKYQKLYFNSESDSSLTLEPAERLYIYVTVNFPEDETVWDSYFENVKDNRSDLQVINTFWLKPHSSNNYNKAEVTHTLKETGIATLQKGVYGIYSYKNSGYKLTDSRNIYTNSAADTKYVVYYVALYNGGTQRLYLNDMYDVLPKGFTYDKLCYAKSQVTGTASNSYTPSDESSRLANLENSETHKKITYKNVVVTKSDSNGKLKFTFSRNGNAGSPVAYDKAVDKCYLNSNEAIVFGYRVKIGAFDETDTTSLNTVAMNYYDPDGGVFKKAENIKISASLNTTMEPNEGSQNVINSANASSLGYDALGTASDWLESNVTITTDKIKPGVVKKAKNHIAYDSGTFQISSKEIANGENGVDKNDAVEWNIQLRNDGKKNISEYEFVDILDSPYVFGGISHNKTIADMLNEHNIDASKYNDVNFSVVYPDKNETSSVKLIKDIVFDKPAPTKVQFNTSGEHSYSANMGEWKTCQFAITGFGNNSKTYSFRVKFDYDDENKQVKLYVRFGNYGNKDGDPNIYSGPEVTIPAGGYAHLKIFTNLIDSNNGNKTTFKNTVQFRPKEEFESIFIDYGSKIKELKDGKEIVTGVEDSDTFTLKSDVATTSYETVTAEQETPESDKDTGDSREKSIAGQTAELYYDSEYDVFKPFWFSMNVTSACKNDITEMVIVNSLPKVGDQNVGYGGDRNSEFDVMFRDFAADSFEVYLNKGKDNESLLELGEDYTIELSEEQTPLGDSLDKNGNASIWKTYAEVKAGYDALFETGSDGQQTVQSQQAQSEYLAKYRSMRVVINKPVRPSDNVTVEYQAEVIPQSNGQVMPGVYLTAWSNFAYRYTTTDAANKPQTLTAYPLKTGVKTPAVPVIRKLVHYDTDDKPLTDEELKRYGVEGLKFIAFKKNDAINPNLSGMTDQQLLKAIKDNNVPFTLVDFDRSMISTANKSAAEGDTAATIAEQGYQQMFRSPVYKIVENTDDKGNTVYEAQKTKDEDTAPFYGWAEGETYTFVEIDLPEKTKFRSIKYTIEDGDEPHMVYDQKWVDIKFEQHNKSILTFQNNVEDYNVELTKSDSSDTQNIKYLPDTWYSIYGKCKKTDIFTPEEQQYINEQYSKALDNLKGIDQNINKLETLSVPEGDTVTLNNISDVGNKFAKYYICGDDMYYLIDTAKTDEHGLLIFTHITAEQSAVLEIAAPSGYYLNYNIEELTPKKDIKNRLVEKDCTDNPVRELPMTGGTGYVIYLIGGAVMLVPITAMLIRTKRKKES